MCAGWVPRFTLVLAFYNMVGGRQPAMKHTTALKRQPTWAIAELFPDQGDWSEEEYLELDTNRLVEFSDGLLEILPMATTSHQQIVAYLFGMLSAFVNAGDLGTVLFAPLRVRLWPGKFREPDVVFMAKAHAKRIREEFWIGADLAMEVVSGKDEDRRRDLRTKRREYARAKISEYWIVDPSKETVTVLRLAGKRYVVHGVFEKGDVATSSQLRGFEVPVGAALGAVTPRASNGKRRKQS
jgi:Uma2 family endonuclease